MKHVHEALRCLLLLALLTATVLGSLLLLDARRFLASTQKRTDAILTHIDAVAARAQRTMEKVEAASLRQKEVSDQALLILADLDGDVKAAYATIDRANRLLTTADQNVKGIGADADEISVAAVRVLEASKTALRPVPDLLIDTDHTITSLDHVLMSPDVPATLHEVSQAAGDVHGTTANLNEASRDFKDYVHRITKPTSAIKGFLLHVLGFTEGVVAKRAP